MRLRIQWFVCLGLMACQVEAVEDRSPAPAVSAAYVRSVPRPADADELPDGKSPGDDASSKAISATATPGTTSAPANVCERFKVVVDRRGKSRHRRIRHRWGEADRKRFRGLVTMVAKEMGADPRLFRLWASRESTYNPYAVHVLNSDLEASSRAWRRHRYDPEREQTLETIMERAGKQRREYWRAKAELSRITRFKNNPHYDDRVTFDVELADGTVVLDHRSSWAFGYGPFGFNPTYFLPSWNPNDPPWVFCNDDGIAAIVTAVWSARKAQAECRALGYGDTYAVVDRRFSSGHCEPREQRSTHFAKRARGVGMRPHASAQLGRKWQKKTTERDAVYAHMRKKALEKGLLSPLAVSQLDEDARQAQTSEQSGLNSTSREMR